ncbi:hypothetical protein LTR78_008420 [Recurvomyces mirabilis]|uniref:Uncharacterized protein n=1 Tax=Recurvomyces mirabilis TaxID=574656 RepID=A0AAE0WIU0_9PEZI|nr:hypothetical protein LTR78_008420 [Recurvomyces mirabilis]KAK5155408.1 hypothetical protein LTS14_005669 [Recurvomyces mirabilis]
MPRSKEHSGQHVSNDADFQWINLTQPDEAKQYHRRIRAHVTRLQHRQTRDRNRQNALLKPGKSSSSTPSGGTPEPCLGTTAFREGFPSGTTSIAAEDAVDSVTPNPARQNLMDEFNEEQQGIVHSNTAPLMSVSEPSEPVEDVLWKNSASDLAKSFTQGEAAYRTFALDDADNIIGRTVTSLGLDFSSVMIVVLIDVRNALETLGRHRLIGKDLMLMIEFEQHLICSINNALQDSSRGLSDQILMAVALCAAYEAKHGDNTRYDIHMTALARMINLRGGFRELGKHDMYITRFLVWVDLNISKIAGRIPYLQDMYAGLEATTPCANVQVFREPLAEVPAK